VVVGGFLKGNWKAGGFGIALASVAGVLLWIEAAVARRLLPRPASP
jgi:Na+(H+)/acetate symporter ActP